MDTKEVSLLKLGIEWKSTMRKWNDIPYTILPRCGIDGIVKDVHGNILYKLIAKDPLGRGTFGIVDSFYKEYPNGERTIVAVKRPKNKTNMNLLEALVQWKTHEDLIPYGLEGCVPQVYDIFFHRPTETIWFSMDVYDPVLFSIWCSVNIPIQPQVFPYILLQIGLILEVFEKDLQLDHRDLKVNNMLIVKEKFKVKIRWKHSDKEIIFPFRIIFVDFGFACIGKEVDVKDGLPVLDTCPKNGRDFFQILVSLWTIPSIRQALEHTWGTWIRSRIRSASGIDSVKDAYVRLTESNKTMDWLHTATSDPMFQAPLCAPNSIINDCMRFIE